MIDIFTLALTHALMAWAGWRLMLDDRVDTEEGSPGRNGHRPASRWLRQPASGHAAKGDG